MNIKAVVSKVENHIYWKKIEWGFYDKMDDESFLKMAYKRKFGKELDLKNPVTFNEKLQWLKLHDRKPEYTTMVDKYEAKAYIAQKIGEEYVVPTLGVWEKFDDIDFTKLPNAFVLKCTHDSGGLVICKDKSKLDREKARKKINKSLHSNYFGGGREWPYKNVKPRIIAEPLLKDDATKVGEQECLTDYKFFCFGGIPKIVYISKDKESMTIKVTLNAGHRMNYHSHQHRDEVWTVIAGKGKTIVDGMEQNVKAGDVITMSAGCRHTVIAETELKLIEVQLGKEIDVNDKQKFELEY
mgnify:CR=1 FL=1